MEISVTYRFAIQASMDASRAIMQIYENEFEHEIKSDGSPVTQADIASSTIIKNILSQTEIPIIDEESTQLPFEIRKNWKQNWCVDPLDGTKEFIKKNGEFSVNIALIENQKPIFGLIASPVEKKIILGMKGKGVYIFNFENSNIPEKWTKIEKNNIVPEKIGIIASRSHHSDLSQDLKDEIIARFGEYNIVSKGSALKFFDLALNKVAIYPRFAPTMEWDLAAGQIILEELGGKTLKVNGLESVIYNKENLTNPHFIAFTNSISENFVNILHERYANN